MSDMEEKVAEMAHEMRRKTHCIKAEMKRVMAESYECLPREREKVKHEFHLRKNENLHRLDAERRLNRSE